MILIIWVVLSFWYTSVEWHVWITTKTTIIIITWHIGIWFSFSGCWPFVRLEYFSVIPIFDLEPAGFEMLLILYFVYFAICSFCHTYDVFPEALVFEGLGLSDMVNNNSDTSQNRNDTIMIGGDLNDALMTMNFHRYDTHTDQTNIIPIVIMV